MDHSYQGSSMQFSGVSTVIQEEKRTEKRKKKQKKKEQKSPYLGCTQKTALLVFSSCALQNLSDSDAEIQLCWVRRSSTILCYES